MRATGQVSAQRQALTGSPVAIVWVKARSSSTCASCALANIHADCPNRSSESPRHSALRKLRKDRRDKRTGPTLGSVRVAGTMSHLPWGLAGECQPETARKVFAGRIRHGKNDRLVPAAVDEHECTTLIAHEACRAGRNLGRTEQATEAIGQARAALAGNADGLALIDAVVQELEQP